MLMLALVHQYRDFMYILTGGDSLSQAFQSSAGQNRRDSSAMKHPLKAFRTYPAALRAGIALDGLQFPRMNQGRNRSRLAIKRSENCSSSVARLVYLGHASPH